MLKKLNLNWIRILAILLAPLVGIISSDCFFLPDKIFIFSRIYSAYFFETCFIAMMSQILCVEILLNILQLSLTNYLKIALVYFVFIIVLFSFILFFEPYFSKDIASFWLFHFFKYLIGNIITYNILYFKNQKNTQK